MTGDASQPASESTGWPRGMRATLLLGTLVSVGVTALVCLAQRASRVRAFEAVGQGLQASLEHRLSEPTTVLKSLEALWLSSDLVERDEFHEFAEHLRSSATGVLSLDWIVRITNEREREEFRDETLRELGGAVPITAPDGRPAPAADEHWVIAYCESETGRDDDVGVDLLLSPEDANAMQRSLEMNAPAVRLEIGPHGEALLVAALPLYEKAHAREPSPPRHALRRFAIGRFRLQPLFTAAFAHLPKERARGAVFSASTGATPLAVADSELDAREPIRAGDLRYDFALTIGGARLDVVSAPTARWRSEHSSQLPWVLFASGMLSTAMIAWYLRSLDGGRRALSKLNADLYTQIAERHVIDLELGETQRKLETLVANLPGLAYRCRNDADWTMEFISDGVIPLTGYKPNDFHSGRVSFGRDIIHPDHRDEVWRNVQEALDAKLPFQLDYRIETAFGETKWVWEQGRGVYSRAGELLALEGFITDDTQRRNATAEIAQQKDFIEAVMRAVPGNFYVINEAGHFTKWNDNVVKVTGYSATEIARMSPLDFFAPADQPVIAAAVAQVFREGATRVAADLLTKDGRRIPFFFTGECVTWDNTRYLVGIGIDVSETKKASEERARLAASLVPTQKLENLGVLSGSVAHDFNNLMTVVLGAAGLAKKSLSAESPAFAFLEQVIGASRSASHLTRQLLDYAEVAGRGKRELATQAHAPLDVSREIAAFETLLRASIPRTIRLELKSANDLPDVDANLAQLQQLVINLVLNAAESYGEGAGGVVLSTELYETGENPPEGMTVRGEARAGRYVRISVRDWGSGLDAATLARLGELFFTTKLAGRGLGLAAVLGILHQHGGWLGVETKPGAGSTFHAHFPAAA